MLRGNLRRGLALVRLRTHRRPPVGVTMYERAGCHLCEEAHRALRRIGLDRPLAIERVDIANDPALERRYLVRIPVLAVGDAELLANNAAFTARHDRRHLDTRPSRQLAIVACMDSRLDIFAALGLKEGEAHILRNAGGVVTDDVIRSLAISQRRLGTTEIMLIHHSDCGMQQVTDDGFRNELQESVGMAPPFAIESFTDVDADVRQSISRIRRTPFLEHREGVRGFVYDTDTGRLREVRPAAP